MFALCTFANVNKINIICNINIYIDIETARLRRRHHQMLPMMIFGVTALGMIMVPLGFQFLAVLGGKALLLSKMALLLASINGLKRVKWWVIL